MVVGVLDTLIHAPIIAGEFMQMRGGGGVQAQGACQGAEEAFRRAALVCPTGAETLLPDFTTADVALFASVLAFPAVWEMPGRDRTEALAGFDAVRPGRCLSFNERRLTEPRAAVSS